MFRFRRNRILVWSLGVSITLHGAFAYLAHGVPEVRAQEPQHPGHLTIVLRTPEPRLTPTPHPIVARLRTRHKTSVVKSRARARRPVTPVVALGHVSPFATAGPPTGGKIPPEGGPDGLPAPAASISPAPAPSPSCAKANLPARAVDVEAPVVPETLNEDVESTAEIAVKLDASGKVRSVRVYRSAGVFPLDRAALAAAQGSTYAPEIRGCVPVGGTYLFTVNFQS
ncbi:MAG: TonB family protein [Vulcanimicrobiaceae bacterium]